MRWLRPVFVHVAVSPERVRQSLPPGVMLDLRDGAAYVSLVALGVEGPLPDALLRMAPRRWARYLQVNLRTYGRVGDARGIVLLGTRVDRALPAAAARVLGMPYRVDRSLALAGSPDRPVLAGDGLRLAGHARGPGAAAPAPGSLGEFLLDRAWVFGRAPGGLSYGVRVEHAPWRVRPVHLARSPEVAGWDEFRVAALAQEAEDLEVELVEVTRLDSLARARGFPEAAGRRSRPQPAG